MSHVLTIRSVQPGDRDEWLRMRVSLWPGNEADHAGEIDDFLAANESGHPPLAEVLVCISGAGDRCGFLELSVRGYADGCAGPVPYVEGWYVDAEWRGAGAGRALMREAERWARDHGYHEIASDSLLDNEVSLAAHAAMGFEEVERVAHLRKTLRESRN